MDDALIFDDHKICGPTADINDANWQPHLCFIDARPVGFFANDMVIPGRKGFRNNVMGDDRRPWPTVDRLHGGKKIGDFARDDVLAPRARRMIKGIDRQPRHHVQAAPI